VFCSMWLQQRISTARNAATAVANPQQAQMNQMMQWMMPALFAWFVLAVPAGVGLYWAASTVIGIILQWIFVGPGDFTWGSLIPRRILGRPSRAPAAATVPATTTTDANGITEARDDDESSGSQRQAGRRRGRPRPGTTGTQPRSGRRR